jgi:hypothetical protein
MTDDIIARIDARCAESAAFSRGAAEMKRRAIAPSRRARRAFRTLRERSATPTKRRNSRSLRASLPCA